MINAYDFFSQYVKFGTGYEDIKANLGAYTSADLKKAFDDGLLTTAQYDELKTGLFNATWKVNLYKLLKIPDSIKSDPITTPVQYGKLAGTALVKNIVTEVTGSNGVINYWPLAIFGGIVLLFVSLIKD